MVEETTRELLPPGALDAWSSLLAGIKAYVGQGLYDIYFTGLHIEEIIGNTIVLSTAPVRKRMVDSKYNPLLLERCAAVWPQVLKVHIVDRVLGQAYRPVENQPDEPEGKFRPRYEYPATRTIIGSPPHDSAHDASPEAACPAENTPYAGLEDLLVPQDAEVRKVYVREIIRVVAKYYKIPVKELLSHRRVREVVRPRQIAMYLAKQLTNRSLPEIGRNFGGRDHTTVLHSVRKVEAMLKDDMQLENDIRYFSQFLKTGRVPFENA